MLCDTFYASLTGHSNVNRSEFPTIARKGGYTLRTCEMVVNYNKIEEIGRGNVYYKIISIPVDKQIFISCVVGVKRNKWMCSSSCVPMLHRGTMNLWGNTP